MADETTDAAETLAPAAGDVEGGKFAEPEQGPENIEGQGVESQSGKDGENVEGGEKDKKRTSGDTGEIGEKGEVTDGVIAEAGEGGDDAGGEGTETVHTEDVEGEHAAGEDLEGEAVEGEYIEVEGEFEEGEHIEGEHGTVDEKVLGEEVAGEGLEGEQAEGEETGKEEDLVPHPEEQVEEEQAYVEEPPPDPAAPYDFSDSKEALKAPFELRPDQLAEVEQLWQIYQNYTPAYAELDEFITEKELVYMLKCLFLMTYTPEQLHELVTYCCRPPHAKGYIFYDQFVKMVTIRQRDMPIEEELRSALQVYDPEKTGILDRDGLKEVLAHKGYKMNHKHLDYLIKEVDMSNDGTIGIEDVIATMIMDLNAEDMQMLRNQVYPPGERGKDDHEEELHHQTQNDDGDDDD